MGTKCLGAVSPVPPRRARPPGYTSGVNDAAKPAPTVDLATLPEEQLRSQNFERAVVYFCRKIEETKSHAVGCGGLYHGANGLKIYRKRRWPEAAIAAAGQ